MTRAQPPQPRPDDLPGIPRDADGPTFRAPWEGQAFGLTLVLHERGLFTWREWTDALAAEIQAAGARGEPDDGTRYYEHWLAALEKLAAAKGLVTLGELGRRKDEWEEASRTTPHGKPIEIRRRPLP
jgi:nitrile hydratase accessory protein